MVRGPLVPKKSRAAYHTTYDCHPKLKLIGGKWTDSNNVSVNMSHLWCNGKPTIYDSVGIGLVKLGINYLYDEKSKSHNF